MLTASRVDWQQETIRYDRPHPRLRLMARMLQRLPQRRLLDVGCSTGAMRKLLSPDFEYYGCDVADHALAALGPDRFQQIDFNQSCGLDAFQSCNIDLVHVGGVFEYLTRPDQLARALADLVPSHGKMVVSIINFQSRRYARPETHHPGWIYKPTLDALRGMLQASGWVVKSQAAFSERRGLKGWMVERIASLRGVDHPWTRRHAGQFVLTLAAG